MGKIRGTHSSPGIYTQITDLNYAAKTLGVTTLGLVGETLKGPAFEPIMVTNYSDFQEYFGGTSAEKFKDSSYPKYELPYIAKSYLSASDQLYVCRVLGLSGYNAGPAFVITAENSGGTKYVIAVLRSRGSYKKYANGGNVCDPSPKYDSLEFDCDYVELDEYDNLSMIINNCQPASASISGATFNINMLNYGKFKIIARKGGKNGKKVGTYSVSLNPGAKDYIYDVLGSKANDGTAALFVEELYDLHLIHLIQEQEVDKISPEVTKINELQLSPVCDPVKDFVHIPYTELKRSHLGLTFLCDEEGILSGDTANGYAYMESGETLPMNVGDVYVVSSYKDQTKGTTNYVYTALKDESGNTIHIDYIEKGEDEDIDKVKTVKVLAYDTFVRLDKDESGNTIVTTLNSVSDYHEQFRCASTPWIVSELKGDGKNLQVKKLFRFHTISDGECANEQVKISIANIRPDDGTFDVLIRDFNDSDGNPTILESYKGLTMVPGDSKYIGLQIGTLNGDYEAVSKYVLVEVIENDMTATCVPGGFLGYPVRDYESAGENGLEAPTFVYNLIYDEDIKEKKQYFGLSDLTGVDVDMLYYKGKDAYTETYSIGYTHGFHLDSTLNENVISQLSGVTVTIDGDETTSGLTWDAVSPNQPEGEAPRLASEEEMEGTIYEDVKLRKFTVYPYGGFDGWDPYRGARTTSDEFKANKYKGKIANGYGATFSKINDGTALCLSGNCITSDYYAFLAGANQFEIPEKYVINLFATPGIDYVNQKTLSKEILDMIEEKRMDAIYVMTTPDKPFGASDAIDEMYSSSDAADNLEDSAIDSYFAATYYPWVKFYDKENSIYINLPATKDALRNMADVDNKRYPWYAPAGIERGNVECKRMHFFAKLEDEDNVYDERINPLKTFSQDGVKIWGNKTMYTGDTPMNRINVVRLMLYLRKLINEACRGLIFGQNDASMKDEFDSIVNPILAQIKKDRGITDFKLKSSQTQEEMDAHELTAALWIKPTPTLEYIEIDMIVTPQGVSFSNI